MSPRRPSVTALRRWTAASARSRRSDLPPGEVEIRVGWSSVNYKDGLATRIDGRVARIDPIIPGIDLAGEVVASDDPSLAARRRRPGPRLRPGRRSPRRVQRVPARAGRLGRAAGAGPDATRRDGHRDGRVHGGDVRRRARGSRPASDRRAGPGHRREWRRGRHGPGDPRRARLRGLGGDRQARRSGSTDRPGRGRHPDSRGGRGRGQAARIGTVGRGRGCGRRRDAAVCPADAQDRRRRSPPAAMPAARSSRRPCSRSSFAASPCSGWTRSRSRSRRRRGLWDRLATDLRPRELGQHVTEVDLDGLEVALDGIVAGTARGRWVVRVGGD